MKELLYGIVELLAKIHSYLLRFNDAYEYCLLYTSDAADEEDSVDLGGCRIIKQKKREKKKKRNRRE